jgi:hypothetical protein
MRLITLASLLCAVSCWTLAAPATACPPGDLPPGAGYLDSGAPTVKAPSWTYLSARPPVNKFNWGTVSQRSGPDTHSVTPVPLPGPRTATYLGGARKNTSNATTTSAGSLQYRRSTR